MYANFTEETCTGTGDVLTLTGASSGNIPFSASFADGDLVSYVAEDSSGNKVAGIGTYSAGTITRSDTWNYNGSTVDKNPSANIALSGGEHIVRCTQDESKITPTRRIFGEASNNRDYLISPIGADGDSASVDRNTSDTKIQHALVKVPAKSTLNKLIFFVSGGAVGGLARVGIVSIGVDGNPYKVLAESGDIDISTSGEKEVSLPSVFFPSEDYIYVYLITNTNDATIESLQRVHFYEVGNFYYRNPSQAYRINGGVISVKTGESSDLAYPDPLPPLGNEIGIVNDAYIFRCIIGMTF